MHLQSLRLTNFRAYTELALPLAAPGQPAPAVVALAGPNGAGKTTLLEAIHFLATARGFHPDKEALRHGERFFFLKASLANPEHTLECNYLAGQGKTVRWDDEPLPRLADHVGRLPVVALLPEDAELVAEGGSLRRRWLNLLLAQVEPEYLDALIRYEATLKQRNALLKRAFHGAPLDHALMDVYDQTLAQHGLLLVNRRRALAHAFQPAMAAAYTWLTDAPEAPTLQYRPSLKADDANAWADHLRELRPADLDRGHTTKGPHRDALAFLLNQHGLKAFGSQGQKKTFLAALKLATYNHLHAHTGRPPLLLLDDLFDKLDPTRVARLAAHLTGSDFPGQVFITDTDPNRLHAALHAQPAHRPVATYHVQAAQVTRVES